MSDKRVLEIANDVSFDSIHVAGTPAWNLSFAAAHEKMLREEWFKEPVIFRGKFGGFKDVEEMTDAELAGSTGDWTPLYTEPDKED